jgi:hypothetical protein
VSGRNDVALFLGPRPAGFSAIDVEDQTEVEIRSHRLMAQQLAVYRAHAPDFEDAYMMLSAPQLGCGTRGASAGSPGSRARIGQMPSRGLTRSASRPMPTVKGRRRSQRCLVASLHLLRRRMRGTGGQARRALARPDVPRTSNPRLCASGPTPARYCSPRQPQHQAPAPGRPRPVHTARAGAAISHARAAAGRVG